MRRRRTSHIPPHAGSPRIKNRSRLNRGFAEARNETRFKSLSCLRRTCPYSFDLAYGPFHCQGAEPDLEQRVMTGRRTLFDVSDVVRSSRKSAMPFVDTCRRRIVASGQYLGRGFRPRICECFWRSERAGLVAIRRSWTRRNNCLCFEPLYFLLIRDNS